jgi:hypothetical protein
MRDERNALVVPGRAAAVPWLTSTAVAGGMIAKGAAP